MYLVVGVMSVPVHVAGLQQWLGDTRGADLPAWVFAGVLVGQATGTAAVAFPLRAGARALRAKEL
ncbi:MAG TPA: hypothetical protein VM533_02490 [Fimbriiglobus sp.]|jgi:hypothetical protein|nr:hypothetical protein [Fimbriiglobus sp.]